MKQFVFEYYTTGIQFIDDIGVNRYKCYTKNTINYNIPNVDMRSMN